jgi:hypothetical protein
MSKILMTFTPSKTVAVEEVLSTFSNRYWEPILGWASARTDGEAGSFKKTVSVEAVWKVKNLKVK